MILIYLKDEMHPKVNKANKKEPKHVVVYDHSQNMRTLLRDHMLQLLLEQNEGSKRYTNLFKRSLNVIIHNSVILYCAVPNNNHTDSEIQAPSDTRKFFIKPALISTCLQRNLHRAVPTIAFEQLLFKG